MTTKKQRLLKRMPQCCVDCGKQLPKYRRLAGFKHCNGDVCMISVLVG